MRHIQGTANPLRARGGPYPSRDLVPFTSLDLCAEKQYIWSCHVQDVLSCNRGSRMWKFEASRTWFSFLLGYSLRMTPALDFACNSFARHWASFNGAGHQGFKKQTFKPKIRWKTKCCCSVKLMLSASLNLNWRWYQTFNWICTVMTTAQQSEAQLRQNKKRMAVTFPGEISVFLKKRFDVQSPRAGFHSACARMCVLRELSQCQHTTSCRVSCDSNVACSLWKLPAHILFAPPKVLKLFCEQGTWKFSEPHPVNKD